MVAFDAWTRGGQRDLDSSANVRHVEIGAALIARDAYPQLSPADVLSRFDALARELDRHRLDQAPAEVAARAIGDHVHRVHGFRGNAEDYGDPRNSYLNDVLERRLGIPITLSIVTMAVARRVGVQVRGVSFPGHFLVRYERAHGGPLIADPFHGGRVLGADDLARLLRQSAGPSSRLQVRHLEPASTRAIMVRMLQNLKAAHLARGEGAKALLASTRIATLIPREPSAIRDRGLLQAQLGAPAGARADLLRYLELAPRAADAPKIRQVVAQLETRRDSVPN